MDPGAISRSPSRTPVSPSMTCDSSARCSPNSAGIAAWAARSSSASETSCCCAPSCRSRSIRRRVASAVARIRAREASSSSWLSAFAIAVASSSVNSLSRSSVSGGRKPVGLRADAHNTPQAALDDDRRPHRRAPARGPSEVGAATGCSFKPSTRAGRRVSKTSQASTSLERESLSNEDTNSEPPVGVHSPRASPCRRARSG